MTATPSDATTIAGETPDQPEVLALLRAADARSASLYPAESRHGSPVAALLAQNATFFVLRLDERAVGCGGFVADGSGEGS